MLKKMQHKESSLRSHCDVMMVPPTHIPGGLISWVLTLPFSSWRVGSSVFGEHRSSAEYPLFLSLQLISAPASLQASLSPRRVGGGESEQSKSKALPFGVVGRVQ